MIRAHEECTEQEKLIRLLVFTRVTSVLLMTEDQSLEG